MGLPNYGSPLTVGLWMTCLSGPGGITPGAQACPYFVGTRFRKRSPDHVSFREAIL